MRWDGPRNRADTPPAEMNEGDGTRAGRAAGSNQKLALQQQEGTVVSWTESRQDAWPTQRPRKGQPLKACSAGPIGGRGSGAGRAPQRLQGGNRADPRLVSGTAGDPLGRGGGRSGEDRLSRRAPGEGACAHTTKNRALFPILLHGKDYHPQFVSVQKQGLHNGRYRAGRIGSRYQGVGAPREEFNSGRRASRRTPEKGGTRC